MDKVISWIITVIGVLLLLGQTTWLPQLTDYNGWLIAIGVLVVGVKLLTNK